MWYFSVSTYFIIGFLLSPAQGAGLFGPLLGDGNSNTATSPNLPLISSLGLGTDNRKENINSDTGSRGLLNILGANNANIPLINNRNNNNRLTTNQNNSNKNVNDIKKQMAEAEKLLERLKELNKLKEQQKLEKEKNEVQVNGANKNQTTSSNDKSDDIKAGSELKSLTKTKFYQIVTPIVPEDEANFNQTVYFYE